MHVRVLNQTNFDLLLPKMGILESSINTHKDKAFISITNPIGKHFFKNNYSNVLNLEFDDATDEENLRRVREGLEELTLFDEEQAIEIINFIEQNKHVETFYVHCLAGSSRSGAVGVFINDLYGDESYFEFLNSNPIVRPNYYILALLKRIYNK
jgi:predicted protein tyrosine phosphatase